jgi:hypothetical protein
VTLWAIFAMMILSTLAAISVDWGRILVAKSQLQQAVDAAARYGTATLEIDPAGAVEKAHAVLDQNPVDGKVIPRAFRTIECGEWNPIDGTFTVLAATDPKVNAVRCSVTLPGGAGGIGTAFAKETGSEQWGSARVGTTASATAALQGNILANTTVPATSNLWLAGMPAGTVSNPFNPHKNPDIAGSDDTSDAHSVRKASPLNVHQLKLGSGELDRLSFYSINGGAQHTSTGALDTADGSTKKRATNRYAKGLYDKKLKPLAGQSKGSYDVLDLDVPQANGTVARNGGEHGKANMQAPYNCLVGVFLGPARPEVGQEPPSLDFWSDPDSREFDRIEPLIAQPFFIGDGRNSDGTEQVFVVPDGATRLYLGVMDSYEWGNNQGHFKTVIKKPGRVTLVE